MTKWHLSGGCGREPVLSPREFLARIVSDQCKICLKKRVDVGVKPSDKRFRAWLAMEKVSLAEFAERSNIAEDILSELGRGIWPTNEEMVEIAEVTEGEVTPNDWFAEFEGWRARSWQSAIMANDWFEGLEKWRSQWEKPSPLDIWLAGRQLH